MSKKSYNKSQSDYQYNKINRISFEDNPEQEEFIRLINDKQTKIIFCTGNAGTGKALINGTPILTIDGWKPIETLTTSDLVAGKNGQFYKINGVYPQGEKDVYRVYFSDRTFIDCCEEHLWTYQTRGERGRQRGLKKNSYFPHTTTLRELIDMYPLKDSSGAANIFIPMCEPIHFAEQEHLISPYLLGCLLGDGGWTSGNITFTNEDQDILDYVNKELKPLKMFLKHNQKYDYYIRLEDSSNGSPLRHELQRLNLDRTNSATKFIPNEYLFDSVENRLSLLKGIIDTDGYCEGTSYDIVLKSQQLILDIKFLVESLGMTAVYTEKHATCSNSKNYDCGIVYRLHIKTSELIQKIHSSARREAQWKKPQAWARRDIEKIEKLNYKAQMTCISIDSPDHLFITKNCIVTHNTFTAIYAAAQLVRNKKYEKIIYSRNPVQLGEEMGFLPGDISEKFNPFMACLFDNLNNIERLGGPTAAEMKHYIEITPIAFLRGRSLEQCILIIDEAQNLDLTALKAILTRVGQYCKVILLGSLNQIDDKHQAKKDFCDFIRVMNCLEDLEFVESIKLIQSKRSDICALVDERLGGLK